MVRNLGSVLLLSMAIVALHATAVSARDLHGRTHGTSLPLKIASSDSNLILNPRPILSSSTRNSAHNPPNLSSSTAMSIKMKYHHLNQVHHERTHTSSKRLNPDQDARSLREIPSGPNPLHNGIAGPKSLGVRPLSPPTPKGKGFMTGKIILD